MVIEFVRRTSLLEKFTVSRSSLRFKIIASLLLLGLLPLLVFGLLALNTSTREQMQRISRNLELVRDTRKERIEKWFVGIESQIRSQAESRSIAAALYAFSDGFTRIAPENAEAEKVLQQRYIHENPHPAGQKDVLMNAGDGSYYSEIHARYHPWLREFQRSLGYYDLFLVDMNGRIVYTVFKEIDFATNLLTGPYANTGLAEAYRAVVQMQSHNVYLSDYQPYAPSNGDAASFIGAPIMDAGSMVGVLLYQMSLTQINSILHEATAIGNAGEQYLIGPDRLMRSDSRLKKDTFTLTGTFRSKKTVPLPEPVVQEALSGNGSSYEGTGIVSDNVFARLAPLKALNQQWIIVTEYDRPVALKQLRALQFSIAAVLLPSILVIGVFALFLARSIEKPVKTVLVELMNASGQFSAIAAQLRGSSQQLADGASQQAAALEQTSASITEIAATARSNADASRAAADISVELQQRMSTGKTSLERIKSSVEEMNIAAGKSSAIIKNIDEIAFQTQLLSLNAAVEAARAGNVGLGFAVVADEVRGLAQRSTQAAKETEAIISASRDAARESVEMLHQYVAVMQEALEKSGSIKNLVSEITAATTEQAEGTDQISRGVQQSERIVQANASSAEEMAGAAASLMHEAHQVEQNVAALKAIIAGKE
jgi:methyl-accepting chemotaxis protein